MKLILTGFLAIAFSSMAWAQAGQPGVNPMTGTMTNQAVPMNNSTVPMNSLPANTMGAPTGNSSLGPAGRPNTELAPSTRGTINSLSNSTMSGDTSRIDRFPQRSMNGTTNPMLPPNTTSPLPTNTN